MSKKFVAVLSSTLLQLEGDYRYASLTGAPEIRDVPHFVGHPATKFLLDGLGAVYSKGLFQGLEVGATFVVAQLKDPRKGAAFTVDQPGVAPEDLKWGTVTRLA